MLSKPEKARIPVQIRVGQSADAFRVNRTGESGVDNQRRHPVPTTRKVLPTVLVVDGGQTREGNRVIGDRNLVGTIQGVVDEEGSLPGMIGDVDRPLNAGQGAAGADHDRVVAVEDVTVEIQCHSASEAVNLYPV